MRRTDGISSSVPTVSSTGDESSPSREERCKEIEAEFLHLFEHYGWEESAGEDVKVCEIQRFGGEHPDSPTLLIQVDNEMVTGRTNRRRRRMHTIEKSSPYDGSNFFSPRKGAVEDDFATSGSLEIPEGEVTDIVKQIDFSMYGASDEEHDGPTLEHGDGGGGSDIEYVSSNPTSPPPSHKLCGGETRKSNKEETVEDYSRYTGGEEEDDEADEDEYDVEDSDQDGFNSKGDIFIINCDPNGGGSACEQDEEDSCMDLGETTGAVISPPRREVQGERPEESSPIKSSRRLQLSEAKIADCSICADSLNIPSMLSGCSHEFCLECIKRWAEVENKCPLCKVHFHSISYTTKRGRKCTMRCTEKVQHDHTGACMVCGTEEDEDVLLVCEECEDMYHTFCLDPPLKHVPEDDWFCATCLGSTGAPDRGEEAECILDSEAIDNDSEASVYSEDENWRESSFIDNSFESTYDEGDDDAETHASHDEENSFINLAEHHPDKPPASSSSSRSNSSNQNSSRRNTASIRSRAVAASPSRRRPPASSQSQEGREIDLESPEKIVIKSTRVRRHRSHVIDSDSDESEPEEPVEFQKNETTMGSPKKRVLSPRKSIDSQCCSLSLEFDSEDDEFMTPPSTSPMGVKQQSEWSLGHDDESSLEVDEEQQRSESESEDLAPTAPSSPKGGSSISTEAAGSSQEDPVIILSDSEDENDSFVVLKRQINTNKKTKKRIILSDSEEESDTEGQGDEEEEEEKETRKQKNHATFSSSTSRSSVLREDPCDNLTKGMKTLSILNDADDYFLGDLDEDDAFFDMRKEERLQGLMNLKGNEGSHKTAKKKKKSAIPTSKVVEPKKTAKFNDSKPVNTKRSIHSSSAGLEYMEKRKKLVKMAKTKFKKEREGMTSQLYTTFNEVLFDRQLPTTMEVTWNPRLRKTAGLTYMQKRFNQYVARIELSTKVVDTYEKLEQTLCHEMCHAATWIVNHVSKPAHGPSFKSWGQHAHRVLPFLKVTTCHQYDIHFKFRYQCTNEECLTEFGRHSDSIDVKRKVCGKCRAPIVALGRFNADGTPAKPRAASGFSLFTKEHYKHTRKANMSHQETMNVLSAKYKEHKESQKK